MSFVRRRKRSLPAALVLAALVVAGLGGLAPAPPALAQTVSCEVNAFDAYRIAILRGWQFQCNVTTGFPAGPVTHNHVRADVVTRRVGCRFVTGQIPGNWPPQAELRFFGHPSRTALRNGWAFSGYELSGGGNYSNQGPGVPLVAYFHLNRVNHTFDWRMSRLVLTRAGGVCADALNEAF